MKATNFRIFISKALLYLFVQLMLSGCAYHQVSDLNTIQTNALPQKYNDFINEFGGSHFVNVNGSKIHYLEIGDPIGEPFLFVHGTPVNSYVWRNVKNKRDTINMTNAFES